MKYYVITGRRSSGETLVLNKQGEFSLRTSSARTFTSKQIVEEKAELLRERWRGLSLSVEDVGNGSGLFDIVSDNPMIGQDGY